MTDTFNAVLSTSDDPWGSTAYSSSTKTMNIVSEGNSNIAPAGLAYKLVVITNKNGTYYYWETSGTIPHGGLKATAVPAVQTLSQITTALKGL
jgi:hypothetical protein